MLIILIFLFLDSKPRTSFSDCFPTFENGKSDRIDAGQQPVKRVTKVTRHRTIFSSNQLSELENAFTESAYLSHVNEKELARRLDLTSRHIRVS